MGGMETFRIMGDVLGFLSDLRPVFLSRAYDHRGFSPGKMPDFRMRSGRRARSQRSIVRHYRSGMAEADGVEGCCRP